MSDRRREVEGLRRQMADADADILKALQRRARVARQIGSLGAGAASSPMGDREELALLEKMAEGDLPAETVKSIFREVHAATFSFERPARVVYVGPEGGFGQIAAQQHFGTSSNLAVAETSDLAVDEVSRQRADFAVIPFESSIEGPLQTSVEALSNT